VQRICSEPIRIFYVIEVPFFVLSFNAVWTRWFMMYVEQPLGEDEKVLYHVFILAPTGPRLSRRMC
jgi:hypothetical protein